MIAVAPDTRKGRIQGSVQALRGWMRRMEVWVHAQPGITFILLSIFYFATVYGLSPAKLLWLDELITLHIASLPGVHSIWSALARGADPNPPLTHILVHASRALSAQSGSIRHDR